MPIQVEVTAFLRGLESLSREISAAATIGAAAGIKAAEESGKRSTRFKDKTGATRASIKGSFDVGGRGFVTFGGMSKFLESGTAAHEIHGNPLLRFQVNGTWVSARMVKHPGTKATHYVTEARDFGEIAATVATQTFINQAIQRPR